MEMISALNEFAPKGGVFIFYDGRDCELVVMEQAGRVLKKLSQEDKPRGEEFGADGAGT